MKDLTELAQSCLDDLNAGRMPTRVMRRFFEGVIAAEAEDPKAEKSSNSKKKS